MEKILKIINLKFSKKITKTQKIKMFVKEMFDPSQW